MTIIAQMQKQGLVHPPDFVAPATIYEVRTGSHAYGVATDASDIDVVGFCVPPKPVVFPHLDGDIEGFGRQKQRFQQFQAHHVIFDSDEVDITIYSVVRFCHLVMDNNPNMVEALFVPDDCVMTCDSPAQILRENRHMFLHKGSYHRFRGFAHSSISKMRKKNRSDERLYKYGYHAVRLIDEAEQILRDGDLVLDNNVEKLRAIRAGDWSFDDIEGYFEDKEHQLDDLYQSTDKVPERPKEPEIKRLLLDVLEEWYGSLEGCIELPGDSE